MHKQFNMQKITRITPVLCIAFTGRSALTLWPTECPTGSKQLKEGRIYFHLMVECVQPTWGKAWWLERVTAVAAGAGGCLFTAGCIEKQRQGRK